MKVALAMIVRGADEEAEPLKRCLTSVAPHVDGMFITITQPNERVRKTAELFGAKTFQFDWCNDFAKARNFSFAQVPKEYDYILWADADDEFEGLEHLKEDMGKENADAYKMFYFYDWDEYGLPIVVHQKTMVVKNDGSFMWKGAIHEDLDAGREISLFLLRDIKRLHRTDKKRIETSTKRNLDISLIESAQKPDDPRSHWNLGNAYWGNGEHKKAEEAFGKFMALSESEDEKFVALIRMATMAREYNLPQAIEYAQQAIGKRPLWPDAYHILGELYYQARRLKDAEEMLLRGMQQKAPVLSIIAFNPRDYDYNPMMILSKVYWDMAQPDKCLTCLTACQEIQPKNKNLDAMIATAKAEAKRYGKVKRYADRFRKLIADMKLDVFEKEIERLKPEYRQHPLIAYLYNKTFIKEQSSGKDIVYFCGYTTHVWNPDILKTEGVGGSEEAVINLSKRLVRLGWNVTVYNNCGEEKTYDGVHYKPWFLFNYRDRQDVVILWRSPKPVESGLNASKVFVDLHDVIKDGEFLPERMKKIDKVFVKSEAHKRCFPSVPSEKFVVVPNGITPEDFAGATERDPYLIINTSSPDRSLSALCRIFPKIKAREPRAKLKWAYGFGVFDATHKLNNKLMAWKEDIVRKMAEAGIENLGKLSHPEIATLTKSAGVYLYPTHFFEIDCISARKAQLGGCVPVTSDFAALETTNAMGIKVPCTKNETNWAGEYHFDFGEDESVDEQYVEAVLRAFQVTDRETMAAWANNYDWDGITSVWHDHLCE